MRQCCSSAPPRATPPSPRAPTPSSSYSSVPPSRPPATPCLVALQRRLTHARPTLEHAAPRCPVFFFSVALCEICPMLGLDLHKRLREREHSEDAHCGLWKRKRTCCCIRAPVGGA
uniref:Uncharacterized protein n=1 Tax=Triticum urartu TaxID=4572 RepID=A0A8R7U8S6_TRIUA